MKELERVAGRHNLCEESRKRWKDAIPRAIAQAKKKLYPYVFVRKDLVALR